MGKLKSVIADFTKVVFILFAEINLKIHQTYAGFFVVEFLSQVRFDL